MSEIPHTKRYEHSVDEDHEMLFAEFESGYSIQVNDWLDDERALTKIIVGRPLRKPEHLDSTVKEFNTLMSAKEFVESLENCLEESESIDEAIDETDNPDVRDALECIVVDREEISESEEARDCDE